jgi:integrase/recombinase XerD
LRKDDYSPFYPDRSARAKAYLETKEVVALQNVATNLRDSLLIRLLAHLGCRITEALSIGVEDIDFANSTVRILHLKTRINLTCPYCDVVISKNHNFYPKCGVKVTETIAKELAHRRQRILPIDGKTLAMIKEYIERGGPVERNGRKLIFGINRHRAWQVIKECAERAGLTKLVNSETEKVHNVSPHRLRDFLAVHAMKVNDSGDGSFDEVIEDVTVTIPAFS